MATAWRDGGELVRDDLVARIDAMGRRAGRLKPNDLAGELEAIRRIAARHGIGPAVTVVHALGTMLARGESGPLIHGWLAVLRDAIGCGETDAHAHETFAAACAVRLNG